MREIKLDELTGGGEVRNLSGHDRGFAARQRFKLDEIDQSDESVRVIVPDTLYTLTPSFFQGMFAKSVKSLGDRSAFLSRYAFDASTLVLRQIDSGIEASLTRRGSVLGA